VKHFTRYGLDGNDDDFVVVNTAQQKQPTQAMAKPVQSTFLDQTIALNDTYALSSPKAQVVDMNEKENRKSITDLPTNRLHHINQSLIGLQPYVVEQLAQSMFDDDDDDDDDDNFSNFPHANGTTRIATMCVISCARSHCRSYDNIDEDYHVG
jgi:hypothetical protein